MHHLRFVILLRSLRRLRHSAFVNPMAQSVGVSAEKDEQSGVSPLLCRVKALAHCTSARFDLVLFCMNISLTLNLTKNMWLLIRNECRLLTWYGLSPQAPPKRSEFFSETFPNIVYWAQHVALVWPHSWNLLRHFSCCSFMYKNGHVCLACVAGGSVWARAAMSRARFHPFSSPGHLRRGRYFRRSSSIWSYSQINWRLVYFMQHFWMLYDVVLVWSAWQ